MSNSQHSYLRNCNQNTSDKRKPPILNKLILAPFCISNYSCMAYKPNIVLIMSVYIHKKPCTFIMDCIQRVMELNVSVECSVHTCILIVNIVYVVFKYKVMY